MRSKYFTALLFATVLFAAPACADTTPHTEDVVIKTSSGPVTFHAEIADTQASQETGLMFRTSMDADHGMLFELSHEPAVIQFWMKNTLIPLDMVFIGQKGDVVGIVKNAVPKSLTPVGPDAPVTAVLEINGGVADKLGIKTGDKVVHPFFQP